MFFAQIFRIVRAVPETLNSGAFLVQKIAFGALKFLKFLKFPNFRGTKIIFFNKNTPELGVSGTALTILKIWAQNIKFEESYGESKVGSEILLTRRRLKFVIPLVYGLWILKLSTPSPNPWPIPLTLPKKIIKHSITWHSTKNKLLIPSECSKSVYFGQIVIFKNLKFAWNSWAFYL